jgi:hypothetical protein
MDNNQQFSPPVEATIIEPSMDFPNAIRKLIEGYKIARVTWNNTDYGFLDVGWLSICRNGEVFKTWAVNEGDLKGQDWTIVR